MSAQPLPSPCTCSTALRHLRLLQPPHPWSILHREVGHVVLYVLVVCCKAATWVPAVLRPRPHWVVDVPPAGRRRERKRCGVVWCGGWG